MGQSAGGSVAMFAAALDTRIAGAPACGWLGFIRAHLHMTYPRPSNGIFVALMVSVSTLVSSGRLAM
jgi:hypothetical protein